MICSELWRVGEVAVASLLTEQLGQLSTFV